MAGLGLGLAYEETYNVPLIVRVPSRLLDASANHRGRDVNDATSYDLVVNMGRLSVPAATDIVIAAYRARFATLAH